tara:strand:- start:72 stop:335 length:264 start_codon:yes stop_codon:yes gene_type:complete
MLETLMTQYSQQLSHFQLLLMLINALVHLMFAGAVARDAGALNQLNRRPALVSAYIWAFATLIGGVFVAAIYWFIHHSNLTIAQKSD